MLSLTAEVATTYFQLLGYRRNLRIAERSYAPAARIGGVDRLDVSSRDGQRRGAATGAQPGLYGRCRYTHLSSGRGADAVDPLHTAGRESAASAGCRGRVYASWRITGRSTCRWDFRRSCSNGDPTSWRLITIWKRLPTRPVMERSVRFPSIAAHRSGRCGGEHAQRDDRANRGCGRPSDRSPSRCLPSES